MPVPEPLPSQEERLNAFIQKYELSLRETEVFNLIREGATNGEISARLFISENTVKFHVRNILKKPDVQIVQSWLPHWIDLNNIFRNVRRKAYHKKRHGIFRAAFVLFCFLFIVNTHKEQYNTARP